MDQNKDEYERRAALALRVLHQLRGEESPRHFRSERRCRSDRRRLTLWSVVYGSFRPRRRHVRRVDETSAPVLDWHGAHLLAVAVGILLLCCADAFLTLELLLLGAQEANPLMASLMNTDITLFAVVKVALTGAGVLVLVLLSRFKLFGRFKVVQGLYGVLIAYVLLIVYELTLLSHLS